MGAFGGGLLYGLVVVVARRQLLGEDRSTPVLWLK